MKSGLSLANLTCRYRLAGREVAALDDVSLAVAPGEIVGLVGESGSGKTTLARLAARLAAPTAGTVALDGGDVTKTEGRALLPFRRAVQIVFQDPLAALNPRATVARLLGDPLAVHAIVPRAERAAEIARLLASAGLPESFAERRPGDLSGGQRQRIAILRALACRPRILICDEPVASLDVSVRAQILNLLAGLRRETGLGLLFISHDLAVVRRIADRVVVLRSGRIVEEGPSARIWSAPQDDYTRALIAAVPRGEPGARRRALP